MRFTRAWICAALLVIAAAGLSAAPLGSITFDQQGPVKLPEYQFVSNIKSRVGEQYQRDVVDADIKRLYATGNFADITARTETMSDGRLALRFTLKLKPRISRLEIRGNAKFSSGDLSKSVTLAEGGLLNDRLLRESLQKLREFYVERGYKDARITFSTLPDGDDRVVVTFKVEENLRLKVHDVSFSGAALFSQWDLRHSIANRYSYFNWVPFLNDYLNHGLLDRQELDLDKARLRDKYQDAGYLDFKITKVEITPLEKDPEYVDLVFVVEEGEPYKVSAVNVSGATVFPVEQLMERVSLKKDETFSLSAEQASVRSITALYESMGYCDVTCRAERHEDFATHTVSVNFVIGEGRKYFVRDVVIVGNTATKDKVIRRELAIQPGDPVDRNRINVSRQRLLGMGYFTKVEADAVSAEALNEKDVRIEVKEKESRYQLRIGAGASDVNSFFGMAEISTDNFDIANPRDWFYGGGQRFRLQGIFGVDNAGFNVDFVEPWLFDRPLRFEVSSYMTLTQLPDWDEWRVGARTSLQRRIFDDFTTITLGYKFEVVRVKDVASRLKNYFDDHGLDGTFRVSQPSLMLNRDTRDSLTEPTEGYNINLFASITPQIFGATSTYYRMEAKGSYYYSFFDKAIVFMIGGKIGTVSSFNRDNDDVPVFERYFLGGSDSLRGFDYRSVSPTYRDDNIGGLTMLLLTAEVSHPIWGPVRGAAFVDAGNAWRNSYSMGMSSMNIGAGYGLRIKLPMINVPLRLDLAYPVLNNQDSTSSKLRIHFNVGFTF